MTCSARIVSWVAAGLLATAAAASAQESAASFDALGGRIRIGQRIWVTDTTGREVLGRLERLSSDDSLRNGTLIGLGIGGGMATAWCIGAIADDSGDIDARVECAEGFTVFPGLGALIGLVVDAVIPGKVRVVYQASRAASSD